MRTVSLILAFLCALVSLMCLVIIVSSDLQLEFQVNGNMVGGLFILGVLFAGVGGLLIPPTQLKDIEDRYDRKPRF